MQERVVAKKKKMQERVQYIVQKTFGRTFDNSTFCYLYSNMNLYQICYLSLLDFLLEKNPHLNFEIGSKEIFSWERPRLWVPTVSPKSSSSCIWKIRPHLSSQFWLIYMSNTCCSSEHWNIWTYYKIWIGSILLIPQLFTT